MQARVTTPASIPVSELSRSQREEKTLRTMLVKRYLKTNIYIFTGEDLAVSLRMRVCVTGQHDWQQTSCHLGQTFSIDQTLF